MGRETNRQRREKQAQSAREKAASSRAAQRQREQRRRAMTILSSVVAAAAVIAVIAVVAITHKAKNDPSGNRLTAPAAVVTQVTSVPDSALDAAGEGKVLKQPAPVKGLPPLTSGGKPELLYIGAEFCPYCAVERWSLAIALSKFGTLKNLGMVRAAASDGNYASLDFRGATYTSKYLTFTGIENEDRNHNQLEPLTSAQDALWAKLDNPSPRSFPTISFGNKLSIAQGAPLDPSVLGSLTQQQIAAQLSDPSTALGKTILGGANSDIAAICSMTNNQPSNVCSRKVVTDLQQKFNA